MGKKVLGGTSGRRGRKASGMKERGMHKGGMTMVKVARKLKNHRTAR